MITALGARFIMPDEMYMTSTFIGFEQGSHLIVSADYWKICIDDVHLTSLEHCEYSLLGEESSLEQCATHSPKISI